jgi:RNA polymerase sigma factor (sigma-70 family)
MRSPSAPAPETGPTLLAQQLSRVALGDRSAFEAVYRQTSAHLFGVLLRICPHRGQAEELLQEVYVKVWRSASGFDQAQGQAMTWLISIARHCAIDHSRRASVRPKEQTGSGEEPGAEPLMDAHPDPAPGPLELLQQATQAQLLQGCLSALTAEQRHCLALSYYQGLSHSEVAAQLGRPVGSVKSWVRRGLQGLKACLGAAGWTQAGSSGSEEGR